MIVAQYAQRLAKAFDALQQSGQLLKQFLPTINNS